MSDAMPSGKSGIRVTSAANLSVLYASEPAQVVGRKVLASNIFG